MRALSLLVAFALAGACSKKEPEKVRTEPWANPAFQTLGSASSSASLAPPGAIERYALAASDVRFSLPAKAHTPRGRVASASGELSLPRGDFARARATVTFDLGSLSIESDPDAGDETALTARALEWLELGQGVATAVREQHQKARFELVALEGVVEGKSPGSWQATARGELSLHGFRVPVAQAVAFELSAEKLVIRSLRPLLVKLAEHDIKPRNAAGHVVATELGLLGTRVGREAKVDWELVFQIVQPPSKTEEE